MIGVVPYAPLEREGVFFVRSYLANGSRRVWFDCRRGVGGFTGIPDCQTGCVDILNVSSQPRIHANSDRTHS
jgi:hypothetical protein